MLSGRTGAVNDAAKPFNAREKGSFAELPFVPNRPVLSRSQLRQTKALDRIDRTWGFGGASLAHLRRLDLQSLLDARAGPVDLLISLGERSGWRGLPARTFRTYQLIALGMQGGTL